MQGRLFSVFREGFDLVVDACLRLFQEKAIVGMNDNYDIIMDLNIS
jgi:hypothetical protein